MQTAFMQEFKPDVVIADLYFSAAAALADKLGVPKVLFGSAGVRSPAYMQNTLVCQSTYCWSSQ